MGGGVTGGLEKGGIEGFRAAAEKTGPAPVKYYPENRTVFINPTRKSVFMEFPLGCGGYLEHRARVRVSTWLHNDENVAALPSADPSRTCARAAHHCCAATTLDSNCHGV